MDESLPGTVMRLRDGRQVTVRRLDPGDRPALEDLVRRTSDANLYLRFFTPGRRQAQRFVSQLCAPDATAATWVVVDRDRVIGLADVEPVSSTEAEIAFLVDDREHEQGIATLLLAVAADDARRHGTTTFTADVLTINGPMLLVLGESGYPLHMDRRGSQVGARLDISRPPPHPPATLATIVTGR